MANLIDRDALIDWLKHIPLKDLSDGRGLCRVIMEDDFKKAIKNMPDKCFVDVKPVRHATRIPSKKHLWRLDEKGEIDIFAMDYGYCNGPVCRVCGHSFCVHCNERDLKFHPDRKAVSAFDEETCDEHLICSECGRIIGPNEPYCPNCGAKMDGGADND